MSKAACTLLDGKDGARKRVKEEAEVRVKDKKGKNRVFV